MLWKNKPKINWHMIKKITYLKINFKKMLNFIFLLLCSSTYVGSEATLLYQTSDCPPA